MAEMSREDFFNAIKDSFFENASTYMNGLQSMVQGAMPVFRTLVVETVNKVRGKVITFVDIDFADLVMTPEGVEPEDVNKDMTTVLMTLHVDEHGIIHVVSQHGMNMFTPANKLQTLFLASLVGKKILFD